MIVKVSSKAEKQIAKISKNLPHIVTKLQLWIESVELKGLNQVKCISGWRDHALKGDLEGCRSISLNKSYRAVYRILENNQVEFVLIEEVSNHYGD